MSSHRSTMASRLHRRYLAVLGCIAVMIVLDRVRIQPELAKLSADAPVLNVAGRQRMLSQRLTKAALVLMQADSEERREQYRHELQNVLLLWERSQVGLQCGDEERGLPANHSPVVQRAFTHLDPHFQAIRAAATTLLAVEEEPTPAQAAALQQILYHEPYFLSKMTDLVGVYEFETRQRVAEMQQSAWWIVLGTLLSIWGLIVFAIRPVRRMLDREVAETENQHESVVQAIHQGLLVLDQQGRIQFANRRFGELLQASPESLPGLVAATLFTGPIGHLWPRPDIEWAAEQQSAEPLELELECRDRTRKLCWVAVNRLLTDTAQLRGWVILVMDITEQRQAERRSQMLADQLAHADRLKSVGEIAAGLAHEVHQPLGAITNYAEGCLARMQAQRIRMEELQPALERILKAALRAGGIIRRVKQFSQLRPQAMQPESLPELLQESLELYANELQRRGIECDWKCSANLPPVTCDALQISQVLSNLLQNAMLALDSRDVRPKRIQIQVMPLDSDRFELTLDDNGPGIPQEQMDRLFAPFSTTRPDGLGLGLSIVKSIIASHGGQINAENLANGGARFRIELPFAGPELGDASVEAATPSASAAAFVN